MTVQRQWLTTAMLGAVTPILASFGPVAMLLFVVLSSPLVVRGHRLAGLSGLLTGFGGAWTFLLTRHVVAGSEFDNATGWFAVGIVPLSIGLILAAAIARRGPSPGPWTVSR